MLSQPWIDGGRANQQAGWIKSRWWWRCRVGGIVQESPLDGRGGRAGCCRARIVGGVEVSPVSPPTL